MSDAPNPPTLRIQWRELWNQFLSNHSPWWAHVGNVGPVYAVPIDVIEAIATVTPRQGNRNARRALIANENARSERAFTELCENRVVGVWGSQPIVYPILFNPREIVEARNQADNEFGRSESAPRSISELSDEFESRALNYVGALTLSDDFREERDQIRERLGQESLPTLLITQLTLPGLLRGLCFTAGEDRENLASNLSWFVSEHRGVAEAYCNFLLKWELTGFAAWDLPIPQQPHRGTPLGHLIQLVGPDIIVDYYPTYYSISAGENVRQQIQHRQRIIAHSRGRTGEFPIQTHAVGRSQLATAFRMWLIEEALRRRYGVPRGMVATLTEVFEVTFDLQAETVIGYRYIDRHLFR
jgi:hypothetical protein